ncbi:MAG: class I SAM-dependent methyltransferase [Vulcanimicrobiaceae bacterium]
MKKSVHPLAAGLISRLAPRPDTHVLELGTGSGRNTAALLEAGFSVTSIDDDHERTAAALERFTGSRLNLVTAAYTQITGREQSFTAAISTHALLHGNALKVAAILFAVNRLLEPRAPFYATFGSKNDTRFGSGLRIDDDTFAPSDGAEQGVPHVYYDETQLRSALAPFFTIESLDEVAVDAVVGRWAHAQRPEGSVHWFVRASKAQTSRR